MTRVNKNKRVVFYLAVLALIILPFAIETGNTLVIINWISTVLICVINAIRALWGCSKKEIESITGLDIFSEK
jgi:hypothetical protein